MDIEKSLEDVGLSRQEAKIYITVLKLGMPKASIIAQKTGMARGGVYYTLKLLKEKGFISEVIKSGVLYYSAATPDNLIVKLEEEKNKQMQHLADIVPQLKTLQNIALERPTIEFYEGYEGFKTVFTNLIDKPDQEFRCYLSSKVLDFLPHFHEQFRKRRTEKHIMIKTITERTKRLEDIKKLDKKELRETRFNDTLFKNNEMLYYILKDEIFIIKANKSEQHGIYIKDKDLAEFQKNIFDKLWKESER